MSNCPAAFSLSLEHDAVIVHEEGKPDVRIESDDPGGLAAEIYFGAARAVLPPEWFSDERRPC